MNELQKIDGGDVATVPRGDISPMELLVRAVGQGGVSVEAINCAAALYRESEKTKAKQASDGAMAAMQAEMPVILKSVPGAKGNYKFAPLDHIVTQVRPLLEKHGFSYRITSEIVENRVRAIVTVTHKSGHSEQSVFEVPVDTRATLMSAPQQYGAAMTFAKRYAFANAFGILTADTDVDGQTAQIKTGLKAMAKQNFQPETPRTSPLETDELKAAKAELWATLAPVRGDQKDWKQAQQWLIDELMLEPEFSIARATLAELRTITAKSKTKLQKNP